MTSYDTTIHTVTRTEMVKTRHLDGVDWEWPGFDSLSTEQKILKRWLQEAEKALGNGLLVEFYTGCVYKRVREIVMASHWPHWKCMPVYIVDGTLGTEWKGWDTAINIRIGGEVLS